MIKALILLGICLVASARIQYNGYKVLRLTPSTEEQAKVIQDLENLGVI